MSADLTAALGRIEALAWNATEGPWETDTHVGGDGWVVMAGAFRRAHFPRFDRRAMNGVDNQEADAEFAAAACTTAPALAAVVRAVLAVLDDANNYVDGNDDWEGDPLVDVGQVRDAITTAWEARR